MTVPSVIACPACAKRFKGREGLEGKKIRCPSCGHPFIVQTVAQDKVYSEERAPGLVPLETAPPPPSRPTSPSHAPPPAAAVKPRSALDEELDQDGNPYGVETPDLAPRCPSCANELESADALICLHCGYNTQTRISGKTKLTVEHTGHDRFMWLLPGLSCAGGMLFLYLLNMWYCIVLPDLLPLDSWTQMFASEAVRLWIVLMSLAMMWGMGYFAHKRLIMEPTPPEQEMD